MSHRLTRTSDRPLGRGARRRRWSAARRFLAVMLLALFAVGAWVPTVRGQQSPSGPAGYAGSRWWPEVERVDASLREQKWKRALRTVEMVLRRAVRLSWDEPDLGKALATLSVQRAVAESALGREDAALWHWHVALNLDPSVEAALEAYGAEADLLRGAPLRRRGHLPDGTAPPPRFATPGYEPAVVVRAPEVGVLENNAARREGVPRAHLEAVVGEDGRLRQPLITGPPPHPVVAYWVLERCFTSDYEVRPALMDGRAVPDLVEIEAEFEVTGWS